MDLIALYYNLKKKSVRANGVQQIMYISGSFWNLIFLLGIVHEMETENLPFSTIFSLILCFYYICVHLSFYKPEYNVVHSIRPTGSLTALLYLFVKCYLILHTYPYKSIVWVPPILVFASASLRIRCHRTSVRGQIHFVHQENPQEIAHQ